MRSGAGFGGRLPFAKLYFSPMVGPWKNRYRALAFRNSGETFASYALSERIESFLL